LNIPNVSGLPDFPNFFVALQQMSGDAGPGPVNPAEADLHAFASLAGIEPLRLPRASLDL
jgi:hypothetical protein